MRKNILRLTVALLLSGCILGAAAATQSIDDDRIAVKMPGTIVAQFKQAMRGYLETISKIQDDMGKGSYLEASETAENTLGLTAHAKLLALQPPPRILNYTPPAMRTIGDALHEASSKFAQAAREAAVTGDSRKAWAAMAMMTNTCAACHAAFRLELSGE
jgi:cytochrome c556